MPYPTGGAKRGSHESPAPGANRWQRFGAWLERRLGRLAGIRLRWVGRRLERRLGRRFSRDRIRREDRKGIEETPDWTHRRFRVAAAEYLAYAGGVILVLLVLRSLVVVIDGRAAHFPFGFNPDSDCSTTGYSCGVISGIAMTFLSLSLASVVFLFWRLSYVQYSFMERAEQQTQDMVPTAASVVGDVVGRDELCHVIMDDLRERGSRRPHLLVGGVGVGKTAVMLHLTKLLAQSGAVPVALPLRDAKEQFSFHTMARERFVSQAADWLVSDAEGEKVWRRLDKDDRIVVLADGLEEALVDTPAQTDRDNLIRIAIREANRHRLPIVIATRPHDPLAGVDAAVIELEPLSEEAALEYIEPESEWVEERLDWIVETADVVETPLYLRIARELHEQGLLEGATQLEPEESAHLDTRSGDRVELRVRLMRAWTNALIQGYFYTARPLDRAARDATVVHLELMACIGLMKDKLEVKFEEIPKPPEEGQRAESHPELMEKVRERLEDGLGSWPMDLRLAAARGAQLELIEARAEGVRFPHSIMQAYLGSRLIGAALQDLPYLEEALTAPGRELLLALVMHAHGTRLRDQDEFGDWAWLTGGLRDYADKTNDTKAIDLLVTAIEIDSIDEHPRQRDLMQALERAWQRVQAEPRTVEEAKLKAVARVGEAARRLQSRPPAKPGREPKRQDGAPLLAPDLTPAYFELFELVRLEESYSIRLSAAHELAAGGDTAFKALEGRLRPDGMTLGDWAAQREHVMRGWLAPLLVGSTNGLDARENLGEWLKLVGRQDSSGEDSLPISLEVALAQGFKHAANRRRRHPHARPDARDYLEEKAREMLRKARFWYSRISLLHALALWALPDDDEEREERSGRQTRALVDHWLGEREREHPLVAAARDLAVQTLETGHPERFIWIDESGVISRIGSSPRRREGQRKHNLWIPPSTGWTALHPTALQLVADVLLLLNLAEQGKDPAQREERMQRARRDDLPPCLTVDRERLSPQSTVGMVTTIPTGSKCQPGCKFELCPYPPKGELIPRVELSEAFCRRQVYLLGHGRVGPAAWQKGTKGDNLKNFWTKMGTRAQR